jgi:tryptophanyl-tRNA synthetase
MWYQFLNFLIKKGKPMAKNPNQIDISYMISHLYTTLRKTKAKESTIYAWLKTGRLLTEETYSLLPSELQDEYADAQEEYEKITRKQDIPWDDMLANLIKEEEGSC